MRKETPLPVVYEEPCEAGHTGEGLEAAEDVEEMGCDDVVVVVTGFADVDDVVITEEADLSVAEDLEVTEDASVELDFGAAAALDAATAAGAVRIFALQTF